LPIRPQHKDCLVFLPALGRVGKTAVNEPMLPGLQPQRAQRRAAPAPGMAQGVGLPRRPPWYRREVSTFLPEEFFRIVALVAGTFGVEEDAVSFETDFVRDLGATEEQRETLLKVLELVYGASIPTAIRDTITTPISAYVALARVGKIYDEEAKRHKEYQMREQRERLFIDIRKAIDDACEQLTISHHRDQEWTHEILSKISKMRSKDDYCCSSCFSHSKLPDCYPEWLYDLTLYREKDNHLKSLSLVLESEWSYSKHELQYDFEKLIQAKCKNKVFICQNETFVELAQEGIRTFEEGGKSEEWYLIAIFQEGKGERGKFQFRLLDGTGEDISKEHKEVTQ
jgi:hypothetical protein